VLCIASYDQPQSVIFPVGFATSVGASVGAAVSIVGGFVGAVVGATIGAVVSIATGFVGAKVGACVAGVAQADNTKVKMINPTKILTIFVFMFSSLLSIVFVFIRKKRWKLKLGSFEVPS
jgi:hypothetical protein